MCSAFLFYHASISRAQGFEKTIITIETPDHEPVTLEVELADTEEKRQTGFMNRHSLKADEGMLFVLEHDRMPFGLWMKNTYVPLDMAFMDRDGVVLKIHENAIPHSEEFIAAPEGSLAALEVPAGQIKNYGLQVGSRVIHEIFTNRLR